MGRGALMLQIKNLTFSYKHADSPALRNINLRFEAGEFVLLKGATGSGKSTLLKAINGLVPHFTGGRLSGSIEIEGRDVTRLQPHDLAEQVAYVNQQPEAAFATDTVEEELSFSLEQLGWAPTAIEKRIQDLAAKFSVQNLLKANLADLSGGQQQRVAIASAMAAGQKLLLLDEPTSALDAASAEALIRDLKNLSKQHGITVLIAEHRFERVLPFVDRILFVENDGSLNRETKNQKVEHRWPARPQQHIQGQKIFTCHRLQKRHPSGFTLQPLSIEFEAGQITGIHGDNGSGKSTLLWAVLEDAMRQGAEVAMVPQNAQDLLFLSSVSDELAEADTRVAAGAKRSSSYLEDMVGRIDPFKHPRDLSAGQQLALVLAIQLSTGAKTLILDEPTRGLDVPARHELAKALLSLSENGHAILIATHDLDFLENVAHRILKIDNGLVSSSGEIE